VQLSENLSELSHLGTLADPGTCEFRVKLKIFSCMSILNALYVSESLVCEVGAFRAFTIIG